jgi:hypothetical protein
MPHYPITKHLHLRNIMLGVAGVPLPADAGPGEESVPSMSWLGGRKARIL